MEEGRLKRNAASAPRRAPRINTSITAKVSESALRASKRRSSAKQVVDHSVPLVFRSPDPRLPSRVSAAHLPIHTGAIAGALSPFVLRLSAPLSPQELIETSAERPLLVNFLAEFSPLSSAEELSLAPEEIASQLAEDAPVSSVPLPWVPSLQIRRPLASQVSAAADIPAPHALLAILDLPEAEEEAESDVVEFTSGAFVVKAEDATPKRFVWRLPLPMPFGWERAIGAFVLLAFAFVLPLHAMTLVGNIQDAQSEVTTAGTEAVNHLKNAAGAVANQDTGKARASFDRAAERFHAAEHAVDELGSTVAFVASAIPRVGASVRAGTNLLAAGASLSQAGARLADGAEAVQQSIASPTDRLALLRDYIVSALPLLTQAEQHVTDVAAEDVPAPQREEFRSLSARLPLLIASLNQFVSFSDALREILGGNGTRKYLAVFQNDTELRPTGGFMGSFAELTVSHGKIVGMTIPGGGTYDVRGSLKEYVAAPDPLRLLSARFEFQDANWFPDFPTSARKILGFYDAAGGPTVDGVIAVNASYVADLLSVLGDVDMPEYGRTITKENFLPETQKIVEHEYDKQENRPKAFIGALAPKLLDRVSTLKGPDFLTLLEHVNQGLERRDIQVYLADNTLQKLIKNLGWDGGITWTDSDYLMVVDANIGGGKTDGVIEENVDMLVNVASDGSLTNTVTVTRAHHGTTDDPFTGVNNVDYLRLYVPKGSELLRASGFNRPNASLYEAPENGWKIDDDVIYANQTYARDADSGTDMYEEAGKTVFGNWIQVKPGATSSVTFTYRLPFKIISPKAAPVTRFFKSAAGIPSTARYTLTVQKQSGVAHRITRTRLELPATLNTLWTNIDPNALSFDNARDAFYAALFESTIP